MDQTTRDQSASSRTQSRRRSAVKAKPAPQGEQRRPCRRVEDLGEFVTLAELQEFLGDASRQTIARIVNRGALRPIKLAEGGREAKGASRLLFSRREVLRYAAELQETP